MRVFNCFLVVLLALSTFLLSPPKRRGGKRNGRLTQDTVGRLTVEPECCREEKETFALRDVVSHGLCFPLLDDEPADERSQAANSLSMLLQYMSQVECVADAVHTQNLAGWVAAVCYAVRSESPVEIDVRPFVNVCELLKESGTEGVGIAVAAHVLIKDSLQALKPQTAHALVEKLRPLLTAVRKDSSDDLADVSPSASVDGGGSAGPDDCLHDASTDEEDAGEEAVGGGDSVEGMLLAEDDFLKLVVAHFSRLVDSVTNEMLRDKKMSEENSKRVRFVYEWIAFFNKKLAPFERIALPERPLVHGGVFIARLGLVKNTLQRCLVFAKYTEKPVAMRVDKSFECFLGDVFLFLLSVDRAVFIDVAYSLLNGKIPVEEEVAEPFVQRGKKKVLAKTRREKKLAARAARKFAEDKAFFEWLDACGSREFYNSLLKK